MSNKTKYRNKKYYTKNNSASSMNLAKKNDSDQLLNIIKTTKKATHNYVLNMFQEKYGFDKNAAIVATKAIDASTTAAMRQTYNTLELEFDQYKYETVEHEKDLTNINKCTIMTDYPDFMSWISITTNVPNYQSFGDTLGYYNGNWEFNYGNVREGPDYVNELIYDFIALGGINDIDLTNWRASDDTILYLATFKVLARMKNYDIDKFGEQLRLEYLDAKPLITNRHPGQTIEDALNKQENIQWNKLQYDSSAKGNGSVMRCGCIGIFYPGRHNREKLIALAIESSRITHNSTIANLGSVVAALFTAYGLEKIPVNHWPHKLVKLLKSDKIDAYMKSSRPDDYSMYVRERGRFIGQWDKYIDKRFSGLNVRTDQRWMRNPVLRYKDLSENFSKNCDTPGACADDCVIMAYDALLEAGNVFEKVVVYSILHPGDSDTVGSVALSWYGALYHTTKHELFLEDRFDELEFHDSINKTCLSIIPKLAEIYYRDIYLNTAEKYIRTMVKNYK